jgi:hypothetical protein
MVVNGRVSERGGGRREVSGEGGGAGFEDPLAAWRVAADKVRCRIRALEREQRATPGKREVCVWCRGREA